MEQKDMKEKNNKKKKSEITNKKTKITHRIIRVIVKNVLYIYFKIIFRVKVVGKENIPKEGAFIMCGNHRSNYDAPLLYAYSTRHICFMAKEELFKMAIARWFAGVFDAFPVKRGKQDVEAIKNSLKVINKGEILAIFPEGSRNSDGKAKNGATFIALKTETPIIPVGIKGELKPFKKAVISFGKPLSFKEYASKKPDKQTLDKVSEILMNEITALTK